MTNQSKRLKNYKNLYPYLLSKQQRKGISQGVSLYAISQLLIAGAILFVWGRSVVGSFKRSTEYTQINPLPTFSQELIDNRVLTPTATQWYLSGVGGSTNDLNTPTPQFIPTQTPWIVTATPTPTPQITATPWYENMYIPPVPGIASKPDREHDLEINAKLSYYYPPYAYLEPAYEINCDKVNGVLECEHMASGEKVVNHVGEALACPIDFPFGTVFEVMGGYYTCRDRGGAITRINENTIWLDLLYPYMPNNVYWGHETIVKVWLP